MTDTKHIETLRYLLNDYDEGPIFTLERAALQAAIAALDQQAGESEQSIKADAYDMILEALSKAGELAPGGSAVDTVIRLTALEGQAGEPMAYVEHSPDAVSKMVLTQAGMVSLGYGRHPLYAHPARAEAQGGSDA